MAIEFVCPACGGTLRVGDETAGRVIRCGGCMTALRVPAADAGAGSSAPPNPYDDARQYPPADPFPARGRPAPAASLPDPSSARPVAPPRRRPDSDEDRARERRSRRRPPPPAGRGVFFWLVVIGAVLLVGVVGCCGGLFLLLPDTRWQTHESRDGGFKVELPSKPQPDVARAADLRLENGTRAEGTILLKRGGVRFVVIYRDIDPTRKRVKTDEQELDARIDKLQTALEAEQLSSKPITVNGFSGREVTLQTRKYGWHAVRVIVADSRVYILFAGGGVALPGDAMVYRFLNSFEITEPELVKEGKRREQQAAPAAEAPGGPKPGGGEKANPWKGKADTEADAVGGAAREVADAALGRAAQEAQTVVAARKLRSAAEKVAGVTLNLVAQETRAARDTRPVAPPLEAAPPPRPVGAVSSPAAEAAPPPRPVGD